MDARCRIRAASSADLAAVAGIEAAVFPDPWSIAAFRAHLADCFLVAESDGGMVGYLVARVVGPEAEILNVAVAPTERRRGAARRLVSHVLARFDAAGVTSTFLEVRASNGAALALYAAAGFREVGRRRGYYRMPREDALVLLRDGGSTPA